MKTIKIFFVAAALLFFASCKNQENKDAQKETVAIAISGMTCEIGCAKTIQSKLSKKEGVLNAEVIFKDSLATINFDANKTNKAELIAFIEGIAGGELYKASEKKDAKSCGANCSKDCCATKEGEACNKENCDKDCCKNKA